MEDYTQEKRFFKRIIYWFIAIILLFLAGGFLVSKCSKATHIKDAVIVYEEYQEIWNTCEKLNTDLCNMKAVPEDDKMFEFFSKAQRILAIQTNLNRWVETYNAKSKMWGRQLWKSSSLPYQLSNQQFSCN